MRKTLALLLFLLGAAISPGQSPCSPSSSQTCTPNVSLALPAANSTNWNVPLNNNFNQIDAVFGGLVAVPGFKPATINGIVYVDGSKYPFTAAGVQAAITAACNGTTLGVVVIPGTISLGTTGLTSPNNCHINGLGQAATKLTFTSGAATTFFSNSATSPSNITIRDMTLDGGSGTSSSEGCVGMNGVTAPTDITIERVTCQNVGATAFNVNGTTANPGSRVKFLSNKALSACFATYFPGTQCYGILGSNNSHLLVQDNEISGGNISAGIVAYSSTNASSATPIVDIQVLGNRVHDLTEILTAGAGVDIGRARQAMAAGNIFYNLAMGGCVTFEAVWGGTITANSCSVADAMLTGGPILVKTPDVTQAGEVASQDISITGNAIIDNSLVAKTNAGIAVNGAARNITIQGNTLSYLLQPTSGVYGIYLQLGTADANIAASSQNFCNIFTVTGNTVTGRAGSGGAVVNGIGLQQVVTGCVVDQVVMANNTVNGTSNGVTIFSASAANGITHAYIHDNAVEGNTTGVSTDGKTYASAYFWNNNPPTGSGIQVSTIPTAGGTITFPSAADTLVARATTDTLTNKTLTSPALTTPTIGGGSTLNLYKTVTDTPGAITVNANTCTDRGVALAGSGTGAIIGIAANYALEANIVLGPGQAVAGTVHYRLCNVTAANITLNAAATFNLSVIQ